MAKEFVFLVFALIGGFLWWWHQRELRLKDAREQARFKTINRGMNPYHCVAIRHHLEACRAAEQMVGKRFLSSKAPRLPLSGCNTESCPCSYQHFDDRRQDDRRNPYGARSSGDRRRVERRRSAEAASTSSEWAAGT